MGLPTGVQTTCKYDMSMFSDGVLGSCSRVAQQPAGCQAFFCAQLVV